MKSVRLGLALLLCFGAFWGAAHLGILLSSDDAPASATRPDMVAQPRGIDLRRYLPVIR